MTSDDIFELAERLDRIAVAVERIATALEPSVTVSTDPFPYERCGSKLHGLRCELPNDHNKDQSPMGFQHRFTGPGGELRW